MSWIGLYNFDDIAGATVADRSGNGFDIDLTGANATQVDSAGVLDGGALSKSAVGTVPLPAGLLAASETDDRTIMVDGAAQRSTWWVRTESASLGTGVWGLLSLNNTQLMVRARSQANGSPSPATANIGALEAGVRHNYAVTYKRSTGVVTYYFDGVSVGTLAFSPGTALYVGADGLNIAEWGTSAPAMDNLRFADHCADDTEIASLAGTPVTEVAPPHAEGTVTLTASAGFAATGSRSSTGIVSLGAVAGTAVSGVRASSGFAALLAGAGLAVTGARSSISTTRLTATAALSCSGGSHRAGSVTLTASAGLRVGRAGLITTPVSRTAVTPAETRVAVT